MKVKIERVEITIGHERTSPVNERLDNVSEWKEMDGWDR